MIKIGDLVIASWGNIGVIVDIRINAQAYWVVWCDGDSPEWCDREEVSLYENR
tara:strand:+ start:1450 stop:1608 length:159 start_codon:yes stop_codon:yes gene_type:complete